MLAEDLVKQLLQLPRADRAELATRLLNSLREPEDVVATAWAPELERRSQDIATSGIETIPWETAMRLVQEELAR
jgi:putative addiction module component (TIGR02574 family)